MKKNKKTYNDTFLQYALILLIVLCIGASITIIAYYNYYLYDYKEINTSVRVQNNTMGLNTNIKDLRFGKISPGGGGTRYFHLSSDRSSIVRIKTTGPIDKFITLSEYEFILEPNETKTITASIEIPDLTPEGNYSGKIRVYFFKRS